MSLGINAQQMHLQNSVASQEHISHQANKIVVYLAQLDFTVMKIMVLLLQQLTLALKVISVLQGLHIMALTSVL